ncbi:MAG: DUF3368 domain-containing protein [Chitinophagales bacterium]|nr:DUF3368 domain-containing protein [Chitinophagales bacterium]
MELLQKVFIEITIPPAVHKEIIAISNLGYDVKSYSGSPWIKIVKPKNELGVSELLHTVDIGEAQAITLAKELDAEYLLLDERLGTYEANKRSLKTVGLLGVIVIAKQKNIISEVNPILNRLRQKGFWMSQNLINKILISVNEI